MKFPYLLQVCLLLLPAITPLSARQLSAEKNTINDITGHGAVMTEKLASVILRDNRIGIDPNRTVKVYLPAGYAGSGKSYPVVYYFHSIFSSAEKLFENGNLVKLLDRGFANGAAKEFIFVAADFSTPTTGSVYENSPVSGRWLDFVAQELVPYVDSHFRTIARRESRGLAGDFMGGRGALKLAMDHAPLFGSVYALHPVATGMGANPWAYLQVDWQKMLSARSYAEIGSYLNPLFLTICQAFLPNPDRPPFYCDFFMENDNGKMKVIPENVRKTKAGFLLDEGLYEAAANLRSMRGIAFDWGRFDPIQAHVESACAFSRQLEDLNIEHEAEEYRGSPSDKTWTDNGRFYSRVLPFFDHYLVFSKDSL